MYRSQLRIALKSDCHRIAEIYNHYLGVATLHLVERDAYYYEDLLLKLSEREELWIIEVDKKIIGWSILKLYSPKEGYRYACETSTFFDTKWTGLRAGKKLKIHILERAKALGYKYAVARIMSQNKISINFNLSLGYRIVGEQKGIGWAHGEVKNVTIMETTF